LQNALPSKWHGSQPNAKKADGFDETYIGRKTFIGFFAAGLRLDVGPRVRIRRPALPQQPGTGKA
jgi:hypothetical protein